MRSWRYSTRNQSARAPVHLNDWAWEGYYIENCNWDAWWVDPPEYDDPFPRFNEVDDTPASWTVLSYDEWDDNFYVAFGPTSGYLIGGYRI